MYRSTTIFLLGQIRERMWLYYERLIEHWFGKRLELPIVGARLKLTSCAR
jgi:hypothetical protein